MLVSYQGNNNSSSIYRLRSKRSSVLVTSHSDSRRLLNEPQIIGMSFYRGLICPTQNMLSYIMNNDNVGHLNILNIMRGGLNFPIEEACINIGQCVEGISFITVERCVSEKEGEKKNIIDHKIALVDNATLLIGDIIASGDTIRKVVQVVIDTYMNNNLKIKKIIFLTIGTVNALEVAKELNEKIAEQWSDFKEIVLVFYEGIFSTYEDRGMTYLNTPKIDFMPRKGFICPEYRQSLLENKTAIFEKCVVYDGGGRRFEPTEHIGVLLNYWRQLCGLHALNVLDFLEEKKGYGRGCTFEEWLEKNHYTLLIEQTSTLHKLYLDEEKFAQQLNTDTFAELCRQRYEELGAYYENIRF